MRGITPAQNRKIHTVARDYAIDNEMLHEIVHQETGKESIATLSIMEAVKVIDRLEGRRQVSNSEKEHMSYRQEAFIKGLAKELGWVDDSGKLDEKRLNGFCRKYCGIERYKWLSMKMASKVIEGLKNLKKHEEEAQQKERTGTCEV